jgi:hypothetical protein
LKDFDIDGRIRLKWEVGLEGMNWIHLDQNSDQWWVLEKTIMNLWVP